jgi:hypothetical protein
LLGTSDCHQCGGLHENAGLYSILEFSHSVVTFDNRLDSHRRTGIGSILRLVNEGGGVEKCNCLRSQP